jgi:hypothetical protein
MSEYYGTREITEQYQVSRQAISLAIKQRRLHAVKVGRPGKWYVHRAELARWWREHEHWGRQERQREVTA